MSENDQHQFKDRYMIRLPDGMRERIKAAAELNQRSMNAEIVAVLTEHYPAEHVADHIEGTINYYMRELEKTDDAERRARIIKMMGIAVSELRSLAKLSPFRSLDDYLDAPGADQSVIYPDIDPPGPAPKLGKNEPPF